MTENTIYPITVEPLLTPLTMDDSAFMCWRRLTYNNDGSIFYVNISNPLLAKIQPRAKWEFPTKTVSRETPSGSIEYVIKDVSNIKAVLIVAGLGEHVTGRLIYATSDADRQEKIDASMDEIEAELLKMCDEKIPAPQK